MTTPVFGTAFVLSKVENSILGVTGGGVAVTVTLTLTVTGGACVVEMEVSTLVCVTVDT